MGKGKGFSDSCLMLSVVIINMICGILGALIFSLAVWMRLEPDVRDWVRELGLFQYWNGLYILMAAGIIIMLISFCGCCGALQPNIPLLATSGAFVILAIILELAGGILIILNGTHNASITPYLTRTFDKLIVDSNYNPRANRYLQLVQEKVGCCGSNNYQDYGRNNLPISDYCRDAVSGNVYKEGCVEKFSIFIEKRAGWIAGIAIFVAFLQILLLTFTFIYVKSVRANDDPGFPRKPYSEVSQHEVR